MSVVRVDVKGIIALDLFTAVVESQQVEIFLGMDPDLLFPGLILEAQLVEAVGLVALGADDRAGLMGRKRVWRNIRGVIGAPGYQWLVRITLQERH